MMDRLKRLQDWALRGVLTGSVALALVLASATTSSAQDSAEDEVRLVLDNMYLGFLLGASTTNFRLDGPVQVRDVGPQPSQQFEVVLPGIRFVPADSDVGQVDLGDIVLKITILGEGRFEMSAELPRVIAVRDRAGEITSRLNAQRHEFEGIWNANFSQFEAADLQSTDWRLKTFDGTQLATISSAQLTTELAQTSPTHGDSIVKFELTDLSVTASPTDILRIDRVIMSGNAKNSDLEAYGKLLGDLATNPARDPSDPETLGVLDDLLLANLRILGDVDYLFRVEGLLGRFGTVGQGVDRMAVESVEFGFGVEGLGDATGSIRLSYGHRGVDLTIDEVPPGVMPHSVGLSLSFQGLPLPAMIQDLVEYADLTVDEEPDPVADAALAGSLLGLMLGSESLLVIEELSLESVAAAIEGRGTVRPDPAGAVPVMGKGRITIHGLERLQRELLSDLSGDTLGYVAILGILVALGEEIEDDQGRAHVYNLEMSPEGKLLINGEDFGPLLGELNSP